MKIKIPLPAEFNYDECLVYLNRSAKELLHFVDDGIIYKAIVIDNCKILMSIEYKIKHLSITISGADLNQSMCASIKQYIIEWFDLKTNLNDFYKTVKNDKMLKPLTTKYSGLRLIGVPDIYEALCWCVIGQQINLSFAYELKKQFVQNYGESISNGSKECWLFPKADIIMKLDVEDLRKLKFTGKKSRVSYWNCYPDT